MAGFQVSINGRFWVSTEGLPGVGKTAIARELARTMAAVHLRIDSIEQALRSAGYRVEGEGYDVAYAVAEDIGALSPIISSLTAKTFFTSWDEAAWSLLASFGVLLFNLAGRSSNPLRKRSDAQRLATSDETR